MQEKNNKKENMVNDELRALKPDLEKMLEIIRKASKKAGEGTSNAGEEARNIMGEAQMICENVKNRINSLID